MTRFEAWAAENGVPIEIRRFPAGTRTAAEAADAIGCDVDEIVKSLVFSAGGTPLIALVSGGKQLDPERLAAFAGGEVGKADAALVREATGYSIGGVPPFGHATKLPVYVDRDLLRFETVWAAAGTPDSVFAITPELLVRLSGGTVADLS